MIIASRFSGNRYLSANEIIFSFGQMETLIDYIDIVSWSITNTTTATIVISSNPMWTIGTAETFVINNTGSQLDGHTYTDSKASATTLNITGVFPGGASSGTGGRLYFTYPRLSNWGIAYQDNLLKMPRKEINKYGFNGINTQLILPDIVLGNYWNVFIDYIRETNSGNLPIVGGESSTEEGILNGPVTIGFKRNPDPPYDYVFYQKPGFTLSTNVRNIISINAGQSGTTCVIDGITSNQTSILPTRNMTLSSVGSYKLNQGSYLIMKLVNFRIYSNLNSILSISKINTVGQELASTVGSPSYIGWSPMI